MPTVSSFGLGSDSIDLDSNVAYLSDLSPKDKPWDRHRSNADEIARLFDLADRGDKADKIRLCATYLAFQLSSQGLLKLFSARFCRLRDCSVCQWRRALKWKARAFKGIGPLIVDYPNYRWVFLTLTVRNCEISSLRAVISFMNTAFSKFTRRSFFRVVSGFIKTIEVTASYDCYLPNNNFVGRMGRKSITKYEKEHRVRLRLEITDEAHPHFHVLLFVPPSYFSGSRYISHEQYLSQWQSCLGISYAPSVHVKAIPEFPVILDATGNPDLSHVRHIIAEVVKYQTKESDLTFDENWLVALSDQMRNVKTISLGGLLKQYLRETESDPDDLIHIDEQNVSDDVILSEVRLFFSWRRDVQKYRYQE